ncbi:MAG TPA: CvpA family protein, partial [Patescibacteria group bacterium]|nr:CvpA family protein [Patescibacteria group bacterium]
MNIIDIGIVIFILFGAVIGFKRGFTKQLIKTVGSILVIIIAFKLKNPVSKILYQTLPFFKFAGVFKGVTTLNILLYEFIAFLLVVSVLGILLRVLLLASSIFETILNVTIVLGIPSKILGMIVGMIQHYAIAFIVLYLLSIPTFDFEPLNTSKYKGPILNNTPV